MLTLVHSSRRLYVNVAPNVAPLWMAPMVEAAVAYQASSTVSYLEVFRVERHFYFVFPFLSFFHYGRISMIQISWVCKKKKSLYHPWSFHRDFAVLFCFIYFCSERTVAFRNVHCGVPSADYKRSVERRVVWNSIAFTETCRRTAVPSTHDHLHASCRATFPKLFRYYFTVPLSSLTVLCSHDHEYPDRAVSAKHWYLLSSQYWELSKLCLLAAHPVGSLLQPPSVGQLHELQASKMWLFLSAPNGVNFLLCAFLNVWEIFQPLF